MSVGHVLRGSGPCMQQQLCRKLQLDVRHSAQHGGPLDQLTLEARPDQRPSVMHVGLCFEASGRIWWLKGLLQGCLLQVGLQCTAGSWKLHVYVCAHSSAQLGRWLLLNMVMPLT